MLLLNYLLCSNNASWLIVVDNDKFKKITSKLINKNPYWEYLIDEYYLPNGNIGKYYYVHTNGSVMIIPQTDDNRFILTKQYRFLDKKFSIEFPGGGIKNNSTAFESALDELKEETGAIASEIYKIGEFNPFNGVTDEICNVFLAKVSEFTSQSLDESEEIEILQLSLDEIVSKIKSGEIYDGMTISAFAIYYVSKVLN